MEMDYLVISLLVVVAWSPITLTQSCPYPCRCDQRRKIVYCNERNLRQVPYGIPVDTKVLLLQGNSLEHSPSLESTLASLSRLERLDMHDNKLTSFPSNLPSNLVYLSLRMNRIKFVGKKAFKNLRNLKELYLDSNNITNVGIATNAFVSADSLEDLSISANNLTSLPEGLPRSLKSARFNHNKINAVSATSLEPLHELLVLDLSYNHITGDLKGLSQMRSVRTIDLSHNKLENIPINLPANVTDLLLSSNNIQYIYSASNEDHGDLQELNRLAKLDLSSNHLRSVQIGAFNTLPSSLSMELHNNPWSCDCNLVYLKRWLTYTGSILTSSEGSIQCATPSVFSGVTLNAMDAEALRCRKSSYDIDLKIVNPTSVVINYDASSANEPPYVTFSAMYGAMLCEDCTFEGNGKSDDYKARMWMEDYTIISLPSGQDTKLSNLKPDTKYAICVVTSYQHPDQIGIEQCENVRTTLYATTTTTTEQPHVQPEMPARWVWIVGGIGGGVLVAMIVLLAIWLRRRRRRSLQSYLPPRKTNTLANNLPYSAGRGIPIVDATPEFDVTLMVRKDLSHHSDSCYSDSHDESLSTTHTGTITSKNSHLSRHNNESENHSPQVSGYLPHENTCSSKLNTDSGLFV
ncbi:unnamed protein product [Clavelina lepadiformis]|uniref:Uncharacterized protein n=1 Tax=Clavelina lepadiformis TaxID=159417 RepID=A0ABP0F1T4_CLALP